MGSIIKGQNLRLKFGSKFVAFSTSCTVHVSANLEDASTKDTTNNFSSQEITGLNWDVSADALYSVDTDATGINGVDALDIVLAQQRVEIEFERTTGEKNREQPSTILKYSGYAWVNDISIQAANRTNVTYTLQATGDGALVKGNIVSSNAI